MKKFAVLVSAMAMSVVAVPIAQAQTETLTGTATTVTGSAYGNCLNRMSIAAGSTFNAVGAAGGSYPGTFIETKGIVRLSGVRNPPWRLDFGIPFTITSGKTTITGTMTNPYPWFAFAGFLCNGSQPIGFIASAPHGKFTGTIQTQGQPAQAISGVATIDNNSAFYITPGTQTNVTETLTW